VVPGLALAVQEQPEIRHKAEGRRLKALDFRYLSVGGARACFSSAGAARHLKQGS
jgi:hypothetical protein